jgi:hypothetical protein
MTFYYFRQRNIEHKRHSPLVVALAQRHRDETAVVGTTEMISLCAPLPCCTKHLTHSFIQAIGDFTHE